MSSTGLANFINALFWVYFILIFIRVLFSWVRPSGGLITVYRFVYDVTEPYLGLFRRIVPVAGGIDFSPMVGMMVLLIIRYYLLQYII
ncbi:MAG: YggT family protein [Actinomycetota bacterium]|jgi:YggT family protein|nr:YggT family protein [Actinomycetota bacterium]MCL6092466.1 YggT family protein [Actinomycetota bacterium]MDA8167112.1 YggT family protein [Actinomycetota bacterium]